MSSPTWQDRRFMWQKGKESRDATRKTSLSGDQAVVDTVQKVETAERRSSFTKPNTSDNPFLKRAATSPVTTLPSAPLRDRHLIWQKGKEVHEPARKMSQSDGPSMSAADRRRSSASSATSQSAVFGNLLGFRAGPEKGGT